MLHHGRFRLPSHGLGIEDTGGKVDRQNPERSDMESPAFKSDCLSEGNIDVLEYQAGMHAIHLYSGLLFATKKRLAGV